MFFKRQKKFIFHGQATSVIHATMTDLCVVLRTGPLHTAYGIEKSY